MEPLWYRIVGFPVEVFEGRLYEKPLDFVSAAERRQLMKEAGGDEAKAIEMLTQQNKDAAAEAGEGDSEAAPKKKKESCDTENVPEEDDYLALGMGLETQAES